MSEIITFTEPKGLYLHVEGHDKPVFHPDSALIDLKTVLPVYGRKKSSLWADIKAGRFPTGTKIGPNSRRWTVKSVREKLEELAAQSEQNGGRRA